MAAKITGFDKVIANLNKEVLKIEGLTMKGLIRSAFMIRRDMAVRPPLIPIDLGNLNASWFITPFRTTTGPVVFIGFTANYAVYVHEDLMQKKFKRPGSGPKFLEAALKRNKEEILVMIAKNIKV